MAGNSEEGEAGADWLAPLFAQLQKKIQQVADLICNEDPKDLAGAVRVARALGVVARSARAVDALRQRARVSSEEDEMGGRTYDPAEDERIRQKLLVESARIERIFERKDAARTGWCGAEAARPVDECSRSPAAAQGG